MCLYVQKLTSHACSAQVPYNFSRDAPPFLKILLLRRQLRLFASFLVRHSNPSPSGRAFFEHTSGS
jgi:hypothetical protein